MSGMYLCARQAFGEGLDWRSAEVKAALVDASYSFSEKHASVAKIQTVGEPQDVFSREIPNGEAMVDTDPLVFDTPVNKTVGFTLIYVDDTPIVLLPLEKQLLTNGGEVEVALPQHVFSL
jgi:hypothetical protein